MKSTRLPSPCDLGCQEHSVSKSRLSSVLSRTRAHHTGKTHVGLVVNLGHLESRISVESARVQARHAVCQAREGLRTSAQQRGLHLEDLRDAETQVGRGRNQLFKNFKRVACTKEYKRRKGKLSERGETAR